MDVFETGSNAKFLSKDIITEFAGRGDEIHMYPLSFAGFMTVYNGDKYMGLSEYMLYGGIPLVVLRNNAQDKALTLQNLFNEIYIRDIYKRNSVRNWFPYQSGKAEKHLQNSKKIQNNFQYYKEISGLF